MVFLSFIIASLFINLGQAGTEEESLRDTSPSFRALMRRQCGATASTKTHYPSFSAEADLENLGVESEEEGSVTGSLPERFQNILQQEESVLQQYRAALQVVCDACVQKKSDKKKNSAEPKPDLATLLPDDIKDPQLFGQWLKERTPKDYLYDFSVWHAVLRRVKLSRPVSGFLLGRIDESIRHMTTLRRQWVTDFGEFGFLVGKPETHAGFFQKSAELAQNLIDHGAEEETFVETFIERQGGALAAQQWKVAQAHYVQSLLQMKLKELEVEGLIEEIKRQRDRLGGRLSKMFSYKMSFYSDAFMFVYQKNLDAFLEAKGGIDQLWRHLRKHKEEVIATPHGEALYGILVEQQQNYVKARQEVKEWLARIRAGEEAAPEKSSLKALMDSKKTLDLDQSFSHVEEDGTTRIRHILTQEAALNEKAGHLEEGDRNKIQDMFDSFIRDLLERDGRMSGTYELASLPARLAHIVATSEQELEALYMEIAKKWSESTIPGEGRA